MKKIEMLMPPPVHPGEVLREDFVKPLVRTVNKLALELHVPATRLGEIVHARRRVTVETALRWQGISTQRGILAELADFYDLEVSKQSGKVNRASGTSRTVAGFLNVFTAKLQNSPQSSKLLKATSTSI